MNDADTNPDVNPSKLYVVFRPDNLWAVMEGVRFEFNPEGDILFYGEDGRISGAVPRGTATTVVEKHSIDKECLYKFGIEKRPPPEPKELSVVDLIEQRKVILDEVENTSEGFRAVVFNTADDRDEVLGEFDTFAEAVKAVWKYKQLEKAGNKNKIEQTAFPADADGYYLRKDTLPKVHNLALKVPVRLKYHDGTTEQGWYTKDGHFLRIVALFGVIDLYTQHPKKMVVGWKYREIYPPMGPR